MNNEIKEFNKTEAGLADLESKYSLVADVSTPDGYEENRKGLSELRSIRTSTDKMRKDLGADARNYIASVNGKAKAIIDRVVVLENPMKEAKKSEDEKAERILREEAEKEQRRVEAIESAIKWMRNLVFVNRTPVSIGESIKQVESIIPDDGSYDEFADAISHVKSDILIELNIMMDDAAKRVKEAARVADEAAKQKEQRKVLEAQQAEIDRQKAEQQAVADKEAEKLAEERAVFEAEKTRAEEAKLMEAEKIAAAERQKERDAAIEKQKAEEAEAEKKRNAEETACILADRDRFADDEAELVEFANEILKTTIDVSLLSTTEAVDVAEIAKSALASIAENIVKSAVVQSQHVKPEEDAA